MATTTTKKKVEKTTSKIIGQARIKKHLEVAVKADYPALLVGETGTGKTSMIQDLANQHGKEWVRFNLTGDTTVDEFVGKYTLKGGETVWEDGILLQAMKAGKWLIVDEINVALPEILFALHSLLDDDKFVVVANHNGEVVRPHEDFRFFGTMNPVEEYAGTKELNKAFMSRFPMIMRVEYLPKKDEVEVVRQHSGIDKLIAVKIVDVAIKARQAKANNEIFYTCSTRDLIHWAKLTAELGIEEAFTLSVLGKAGEDRDKLIKIYDNIVSRYQQLEKATDGQLSVEWFEEQYAQISELEAKTEERVKSEVREKLAGIV